MSTTEVTLDPVKVAEAYYALPPSQRIFKALVDKFGLPPTKASADRLARLVREHEERGLIHHEVLEEKSEYLPRKPRLEDALRRRFDLRQAVVVDISSLGLNKGHAAAPDQRHQYDDEIHMRLGAWGGRILASNLRRGDHIATGGGRGPYFTAQKTHVWTANRHSGSILPLTGLISARTWNPHASGDAVPTFLDADNVASLLHGRLGSRGQLLPLDRPITELERPPDPDNVTVAMFGIGALGGGHRLKHFQHLDDLRSVEALLRDINVLAEAIERKTAHQGPPFFHPVGDVCNCYFVVEDHQPQGSEREWKELQAKVTQLNEAFSSVTPASLGRIAREGMALAVAGGRHKAFSIRHVLRNSRRETWITHLVTDHKTAEWILDNEPESTATPRPAPAPTKPAPGPAEHPREKKAGKA